MSHMTSLAAPSLSWLLLLPLVGITLVFALRLAGPRHVDKLRWLMLALMGSELALAAWLYTSLDGSAGFHLTERFVVSRSLGFEYFVGVDGISIAMVGLTTLLAFVGVLASWSVRQRVELYWSMYCLAIVGMLGVFLALDLLLFFASWMVALSAFCALVGIFGGKGKRRALLKLTVGHIACSALLLFAILALSSHSEPLQLADGSLVERSFAIPELAQVDYLQRGPGFVKMVFVALFLAFAGTLAIVPFHVSIFDAIVEAPTAISVLMAGVFVKMGGHGLLRIGFGILPEASAWAAKSIAILGVASLLYGSVRAMMQTDLKRFVAYVSFGQIGFSLLAMGSLTPAGIQASVLQMVSHGLVSAMLFLLVGGLHERVETYESTRFGGLAREMPAFSMVAGFAFLASLGAPGLSTFIADTMTLAGAFPVHIELVIIAAVGIVLAAAYHLRVFQRVFLGDFRNEWRSNQYLEPFGGKFPELRPRELAAILPLALASFVLGFWPRPLLGLLDAQTLDLVNRLRPLGPMQISLFDAVSRAFSLFC